MMSPTFLGTADLQIGRAAAVNSSRPNSKSALPTSIPFENVDYDQLCV